MNLDELRQLARKEDQKRVRMERLREAKGRSTGSPSESSLPEKSLESKAGGATGSNQTSTDSSEMSTPASEPSGVGSLTRRSETTIGGRMPLSALSPMPRHLVGPTPLTVRNRGGHYIFLNDPERGTVRAMINELGDLVEPEALHPFFD